MSTQESRTTPATAVTVSSGPDSAAGAVAAGLDTRGDIKSFVVHLRNAGWPEENLVMLIKSDYFEKESREMCELTRKANRGQLDRKTIEAASENWYDKIKAAVDDVLGPGAYERYEKSRMVQAYATDYQPLDGATSVRLYDLDKKFQQAQRERVAKMRDESDSEEERRDYMAARVEYDRNLKEILGEKRYAEYKLQQSNA